MKLFSKLRLMLNRSFYPNFKRNARLRSSTFFSHLQGLCGHRSPAEAPRVRLPFPDLLPLWRERVRGQHHQGLRGGGGIRQGVHDESGREPESVLPHARCQSVAAGKKINLKCIPALKYIFDINLVINPFKKLRETFIYGVTRLLKFKRTYV